MRYNTSSIILLAFAVFVACTPKPLKRNNDFQGATANMTNPFSEEDAEEILGAPAANTSNSTQRQNAKLVFSSEFTADTLDSLGRLGKLYFMYQEFAEIDSAKASYKAIKDANANHDGIEVLNGYGDEAYFHSDGENFYFILARKGTKEIRIKLNKIIATSTKENFLSVSKRIINSQ